MRELDTASPVVWPAWCYSGESQEVERGVSGKKWKGEGGGGGGGGGTKRAKMTTVEGGGVGGGTLKSERLSPSSSSAPPDTGSGSSRSGTPSSSCTPPRPGPSPSHPPPPTPTTAALARNYSDFMRSLAAKYNNNNPNDYFSLRNGFGSFKPGSSPPFPGLLPPATTPSGVTKDDDKSPAEAQTMLGFVPFAPVFPPVMDMNATQALLTMVRTHQQGAHLESYLKREAAGGGGGGVLGTSAASPLDLSTSAPDPLPLPPPPQPKKAKKPSLSESLYGADLVPLLRAARKPSSSAPLSPRTRKTSKASPVNCPSACSLDKPCTPDSQTIAHWSVDDVAGFVANVDMCAEYVPTFREQRIDGSVLALLTEEHLTTTLGMKLGPALKLRSILSSKLGQCAVCLHCTHCHTPPPSAHRPPPPRIVDK